jgi:hypothetical protein
VGIPNCASLGPEADPLEARLICTEICGNPLVEQPPAMFDSFFRRTTAVISRGPRVSDGGAPSRRVEVPLRERAVCGGVAPDAEAAGDESGALGAEAGARFCSASRTAQWQSPQAFFVMAVSDQAMAHACCKALPLVMTAVIPWVVAFIKKVTGFAVMARVWNGCWARV